MTLQDLEALLTDWAPDRDYGFDTVYDTRLWRTDWSIAVSVWLSGEDTGRKFWKWIAFSQMTADVLVPYRSGEGTSYVSHEDARHQAMEWLLKDMESA